MRKWRKRDKYSNINTVFFFQKMVIKTSLSTCTEHMWLLGWKLSTRPLTQGSIFTHLYLCQNLPSEGCSMLSASLHADFVHIVTSYFAIWNQAQGDNSHNFIVTDLALYISCHEALSNKHLYDHITQHAI